MTDRFDPLTIETPADHCGWDGRGQERICLRPWGHDGEHAWFIPEPEEDPDE